MEMRIFRKEKFSNGRRHIYFCGVKIASYKRKKKITEPVVVDPVEKARSLGVTVGNNVRLIVHPHPWSLPDFGSEPYLISIGDDTCISFGVSFVTHDASIHVCEKYDKECPYLLSFGKISVGKNCFIGCRSIILRGVTIGDNSIVGAGSVVTKSIPSGEIWAGCPAKFVSKLEDYIKKSIKHNTEQEFLEAYDIVRQHRKNG